MMFRDGADTHLYRASTVCVNDSFALPSKQVYYPGCKFIAKTLSVPINELNACGPVGTTRFGRAFRVKERVPLFR